MNEARPVTGFDAGLSGDDQIRVALQRIIERGGEAEMADSYEAVDARLPEGCALFDQGRASLRFLSTGLLSRRNCTVNRSWRYSRSIRGVAWFTSTTGP